MSCDVFFLSYNEDFADENYELVQLVAPLAKHVRCIKGIFNAHKECARQSLTKIFYVIDADAILERGFYLDFEPSDDIEWWPGVPQTACVHVWRSRNPINGLIYGYGGVKLFPKQVCTVPMSDPSEVRTSIFCASLYSPLGTNLSSKSLFIRPDINVCFNSGILVFYLFRFTSQYLSDLF